MDLSLNKNSEGYVLECVVQADDIIDTTAKEMITGHDIRGIARAEFVQYNEQKKFTYKLGKCIPLNDFFESSPTASRLISITSKLISIIESADEYMLDPSGFLLNANSIFINSISGDILIVCLPFVQPVSSPLNLVGIVASFIEMLPEDRDNTEIGYIAEISNAINDFSDGSFDEIIQTLLEINKKYSGTSRHAAQPKGRYGSAGGNKIPTNASGASQQPANEQSSANSGSVKSIAPAKNNIAQVSSRYPMPNNVPPKAKTPNPVEPANNNVPDEDRISLFYLLQHYNAENMKKYKQQKANGESKKDEKPSNNNKAGFQVPNQVNPTGKEEKAEPVSNKIPDEDRISLFYLLQHYNAENMKKYKAQKADGEVKNNNGNTSSAPKADFQVPNRANASHKEESADSGRQKPTYAEVGAFSNFSSNGQGDTNIKRIHGNFGETVFVMPEEHLYGAVEKENGFPYLIRLSDNCKIPITKQEFVMGRNKEIVDCFVDNTTIGRTHAKILFQDGLCRVFDLGSVNKTFVNGFRVFQSRPVQLQSGDVIRLSEVEFEFHY